MNKYGALPHHMHGLWQLSQDVRCAPSLEEAVDGAGQKRMHEVWKLGTITGEEDLVRGNAQVSQCSTCRGTWGGQATNKAWCACDLRA